MPQKQLEFWPSSDEIVTGSMPSAVDVGNRAIRQAASLVVENEAAYVSLKRVQVVHEGNLQSRPVIGGAADAIRFFSEYWSQRSGNDQERFVVACLNTKNRIQSVVEVTVGTLDASLVHPREVFKPAILEGASSILLSHNHPSGDPTPSKEDHQVTRRMEQAGELLGISVLDHIIHGDATGKLVSLREL